ncbi:hypothetical protein HanPSC8_Chr12g0538241 [Helianthus annuus]|nr:hypothetical protein HanPSC8_Chr12g0538241 [Helianthus annuus]
MVYTDVVSESGKTWLTLLTFFCEGLGTTMHYFLRGYDAGGRHDCVLYMQKIRTVWVVVLTHLLCAKNAGH